MTMLPLYREKAFSFGFAEDRIIPRFHLEGVAPGSHVFVFKMDRDTRQREELLANALVSEGGRVELAKPILMKAGEAFVAMPLVTRDENEQDRDAVRLVNQLAFGQDAEAGLVDRLRAGGHARLSIVAELDSQVVGHIMFSELSIVTETDTLRALALAPMAVLPDYQRKGLGSQLVRRGLEKCKEQGGRVVVVLGHPQFYSRFGFSAKLAERLLSPFGSGPSHMAIELVPGALDDVSGQLVYAPPFLVL